MIFNKTHKHTTAPAAGRRFSLFFDSAGAEYNLYKPPRRGGAWLPPYFTFSFGMEENGNILYRTLRETAPIDDWVCVECLAYLSYTQGGDEQVTRNSVLYEDLMTAKERLETNINLAIEANALKAKWKAEPALMHPFVQRYKLRSLPKKHL
jgi:hypothetical protein